MIVNWDLSQVRWSDVEPELDENFSIRNYGYNITHIRSFD